MMSLAERTATDRRKLVWLVSALVMVTAAVWVGKLWLFAPNANELLARAYTEQRTLELRIPGAAYAPMRVRRGMGLYQSLLAPLLKAEIMLDETANKNADNPGWMQSEARAALLEWDYEMAIAELDDALGREPEDAGLLLDRATAYFERAERLGRQGAIDYGEAAEDLSRSLKMNPDNAVALFNRAIVFDKLYLPSRAVADWERYLQIDPNGAWASEAKQRLDQLTNMVARHEAVLIKDPVEFVRVVSEPHGLEQLDKRIEEYQELAISEWLPQAYPLQRVTSAETTRAEYGVALRTLAKLLLDHPHDDPWLTEMLASANETPTFASGISHLSQVVARSEAGDALGSLQSATQAAEIFAEAGSLSGAFRAKVEEIHALQRSHQTDLCREKSVRLQKMLRPKRYKWMTAQLEIDEAACALSSAHFDEGQFFASDAIRRTRSSGFPTLYLRALGISSAGSNFAGDLALAWSSNEEGLAQYWNESSSSPVRAHQFYDDLAYAAESLKQPNVALAFAQESERTVSPKNKSIQILTRQHSAKIAVDSEEWRIARDELTEVDRLSAEQGDESRQRSSQVYSAITLATIDMRQSNLSQAEERLDQAEPVLGVVKNMSLSLEFLKAKADLLALQGRHADAEVELISALEKIQASKKTLNDSTARRQWGQQNTAFYKSLISEEITQGDEGKAFAAWEQYLGAGLDSNGPREGLGGFLKRKKAAELISPLRDQTIVSYALLPQGLAIWVADNRGVRFRFIQRDSASLVRLSESFLQLCSNPKSSISLLQQEGRRLYEVFVDPISTHLEDSRTLIVEADPLIGDLPFQALTTPSGQYLSEKHTIVFSPGLLYQQNLREPGQLSAQTKMLVVGSTANIASDGSVLQPDANSLAEAREVAGLFAGATLVQGDAATKERIEGELAGVDAFHFAGHALSGVAEEGLLIANSRQAIQPSGLWTARDFDSNRLGKCRIAVLSACSTGRTFANKREVHGEMVRKMLAAGVSNVLASRWNVDSMQTRRFIRGFYNSMFSGKKASEAARDAELLLLRDPETRHPYFWAAFACFGRA